jgi:hypothetical protein
MYLFPNATFLFDDERVPIATTAMLRDSGEIYLKTHHIQHPFGLMIKGTKGAHRKNCDAKGQWRNLLEDSPHTTNKHRGGGLRV